MDYLYKYTSAQGAFNILQDLTVKWSSPLVFNDPFDSQLNISYGDAGYLNLIRQQIMDEFDNNKTDNHLEDLVNKWFLKNEKDLEESKEKWMKYVKWIRIFSMTERNDDLLMWAHYAECHKGAVICFKTGETFENPQKVSYSGNVPKIGLTVMDFAEDMSDTKKTFDYDNFFFENLFMKSDHWKYEKEWRCISFVKNKEDLDKGELYDLFPISNHEIISVYLGCMMEEEVRGKIMNLAKQKINNIEIYDVNKHKSQFGLTFHKIV